MNERCTKNTVAAIVRSHSRRKARDERSRFVGGAVGRRSTATSPFLTGAVDSVRDVTAP